MGDRTEIRVRPKQTKPKTVSDERRGHALITYPSRAGTGVRHVVIAGEDNALCGVSPHAWFLEWQRLDPGTIGCFRCKRIWDRVSADTKIGA